MRKLKEVINSFLHKPATPFFAGIMTIIAALIAGFEIPKAALFGSFSALLWKYHLQRNAQISEIKKILSEIKSSIKSTQP